MRALGSKAIALIRSNPEISVPILVSGLDLLVILLAWILDAILDLPLVERVGEMAYPLFWLIAFIVLTNFAIPIWAVMHARRTRRT